MIGKKIESVPWRSQTTASQARYEYQLHIQLYGFVIALRVR